MRSSIVTRSSPIDWRRAANKVSVSLMSTMLHQWEQSENPADTIPTSARYMSGCGTVLTARRRKLRPTFRLLRTSHASSHSRQETGDCVYCDLITRTLLRYISQWRRERDEGQDCCDHGWHVRDWRSRCDTTCTNGRPNRLGCTR